MKKCIEKRQFNRGMLSFLIILLSFSSITKAYQLTFSFDSLVPATWYQKSLESLFLVWNLLLDAFEKNDDESKVSFDIMLAKLVFAQFCINRMKQENVVCIPEDTAYFMMVLNKVSALCERLIITQENEDSIVCAQELIAAMQKELLSL